MYAEQCCRSAAAPQEKVPGSGPNTVDASNVQLMDDGFVDLTGGAGAGGGGLEDEWEQLVVTEIPSISAAPARSSTSIAGKHNGGKEEAAPINKTLRILERLEAPNRFLHKDIDVAATTNKLIRPNFQRLKRKHKWTPDGLSML